MADELVEHFIVNEIIVLGKTAKMPKLNELICNSCGSVINYSSNLRLSKTIGRAFHCQCKQFTRQNSKNTLVEC